MRTKFCPHRLGFAGIIFEKLLPLSDMGLQRRVCDEVNEWYV